MKIRFDAKRLLSLVLAAVLCLSFLPGRSRAAGGIADGTYVIWAPAYGKALSTDYAGSYYNSSVNVTLEGDTLTGYTNKELWTVTNNADGTITISCGAGVLGMDAEYSSMPLNTPNDTWVLEDAGNGLWYVKNVGRGCYMEWYADKSRWSAYYKISSGTEGMFAMCFTPVVPLEGNVSAVTIDPNGGIVTPGEDTVITLSCGTEGAEIFYMTSANGTDWPASWTAYTDPLSLETGFGELYVKAYAKKAGFADSAVASRTFTENTGEEVSYTLYFGQLHSHTQYSDGAGSAAEAYQHAANAEQIDFLAITDHSNSFDGDTSASLADGSVSSEWTQGQALAKQYTTADFVALFGFEMTWSGGSPGHMNTFNTPGFQSRNQTDFQNRDTALQTYYDTLKTESASISQFNHPGTTFGDFFDFGYYDSEIDRLVTLIEVGNGSGEVGSSGYFPSYEYYTRALDKGWHVAPTNNQDNHRGNWGDSNTARTVVLAHSLTAEGIYDALRNYRVYATEDNDLHIYYTLNGCYMGSILELDSGSSLTLSVQLSDPTDSAIGKVEVIVDGGLSAASQEVSSSEETVTFTLNNDYAYYYIKVTQPDGDIAVTAPVWAQDVEALGISDLYTESTLAVQDKNLDVTLEMFNNESYPIEIQSAVFTLGGETVHTATAEDLFQVNPESTLSYTFSFVPYQRGNQELTVTVHATVNGVERVFQEKLSLEILHSSMATKVIVDGTHANDYVSGYYAGNMGNLVEIAGDRQAEVQIVTDQITPEMLADCDLLIVSAPARGAGSANGMYYSATLFEDSFVDMVADFVKNGGSLVICGLADYQDRKAAGADYHGAVQLNRLLEAAGSTMRINDDQAVDRGSYRVYLKEFNTESSWANSLTTGQQYSQYSGCTVDPGQGTWLVKGSASTSSDDADSDGKGGGRGEVIILAAEETPYGGNIFAAGSVFMSNYEISTEDEETPYANRTFIDNILASLQDDLPLSTIDQVRAGNVGDVFRISGYVTAGTADPNCTFFDTIYVQDETGGIAIFPFAEENVVTGMPIEIIGSLEEYQGDLQLQINSYELLSGIPNIMAAQPLSCAEAMDYAANGGSLVKVEGQVVDVTLSGTTGISRFVLQNSQGDQAVVFIDGYILSSATGRNNLASFVQIGTMVSVEGFVYRRLQDDTGEPETVIRIRDCDEILLMERTAEAAENNLMRTMILVALACVAGSVLIVILRKKLVRE